MRHGMGIERELDERQAMVATEAIFLRLSAFPLSTIRNSVVEVYSMHF